MNGSRILQPTDGLVGGGGVCLLLLLLLLRASAFITTFCGGASRRDVVRGGVRKSGFQNKLEKKKIVLSRVFESQTIRVSLRTY
jgi:hypothetical protein